MYNTIKRLAKEKGMSISETEKRAGLGNGAIGGWRTGSPTLDSLEKVAKALDMSEMELIAMAKEVE